MTVYRVTVEPAGRHWQAVVHGAGVSAGVQARDLAEVEPRVFRLIESNGIADSGAVDLDVAIRLPGAIQHNLYLVESLSEDLGHEVTEAVTAMREIGLYEPDIARILAGWYRPPRALTITNRQIADHGLAGHPDAIGLRWDDHGFARTLTCRAHVEATRGAYRDAPPDENNALVYPGEPFVCDFCHEGDEVETDSPLTQGDNP